MNSITLSRHGSRLGGWLQWLACAALAFLLILTSAGAWASPGAHGPNGEHLDSPAATAGSAKPSINRDEIAATEKSLGVELIPFT